MSRPSTTPPALLVTVALCAFAANSLLCRAALGARAIDAASFTAIRLASGAIVLALLVRGRRETVGGGGWRGGVALCAYAALFSVAYLRIPAGIGALVLFGAVQATMLGFALVRGEAFRARQWGGLALALGGLASLVLPGQHAPDAIGAAAMAVAGVAWGAYSLLGRGSQTPLSTTAHNFLWSLPLAAVFLVVAPDELSASTRGVALAVTSGAVASGLGYAVWYAALATTSASRAAVLQLAVPVIAAVGGVLLLDEPLTLRLALCGALVLGGVALAVARPASARAS